MLKKILGDQHKDIMNADIVAASTKKLAEQFLILHNDALKIKI